MILTVHTSSAFVSKDGAFEQGATLLPNVKLDPKMEIDRKVNFNLSTHPVRVTEARTCV